MFHLAHLIIYAVAVLLAAKLVPGIRVRGFLSALVFALVFAIVDKLLYTVLVIVAFPAVLVTFGLFLLVINAFLFWLADRFVRGVEVDGAVSAFFGSLVTSILCSLITWVVGAG